MLLQKLLHSNDMSDVGFISPSSERDYLVISLVREFYLDVGLLLFLVGIHRLNVRNWGSIHDVSPFALQIIESLRWVLRACAHDRQEKQSGLQKKHLEKLLGGNFLTQPNVLPNILTVSKIFDLESRLIFILCGTLFYITVAKRFLLSVQLLYIIYYLPVFYCRAIH